jgi:hypothetical protein
MNKNKIQSNIFIDLHLTIANVDGNNHWKKEKLQNLIHRNEFTHGEMKQN